MLPVTGALNQRRATVEREVQIWNIGALNCMTLPCDLIKRWQPHYKTVSSAAVDFFGFLFDLQNITSAATWRGPQKKREVEEVVASLILLYCTAMAAASSLKRRKWLMRSGSPRGDAALPSSKRRQRDPPWATSLNSFTICAPLTPSLQSPPIPLLHLC